VGLVNAQFEIWFLSGDQLSVFIETDLEEGPIQSREVLEATVFLSLARGDREPSEEGLRDAM